MSTYPDEFKQMEERIMGLEAKNRKWKKFADEWFGHDADCAWLDAGSPRMDCTCGYEKARKQVLKDI